MNKCFQCREQNQPCQCMHRNNAYENSNAKNTSRIITEHLQNLVKTCQKGQKRAVSLLQLQKVSQTKDKQPCCLNTHLLP